MTPLSNMEISAFCGQMTMILSSGISPFEGITMMLEESNSHAEEVLLQCIHKKLSENGTLYEALLASQVFPEYLLHMVEIGEQSGKLDEVMASLANYYERKEEMTRAIKNAVTYPFLIIAMMLIVIIIILTKVLPVFNQIFAQFGQEMSGFPKALLYAGMVINRYAAAFTVLLVFPMIVFFLIRKTHRGKAAFMKFSYRFHFLKTFYDHTAACQFAEGMALTLSSGLNESYCLELVTKLIQNDFFIAKLHRCRELTENGMDFSLALTQSGIFSGIYGRMISIGSRTGHLDTAMKEVAEKYETELDTRLSDMVAMLEPTLVILLSIIVGFILLSVMLPLIGIMSAL